MLCGKLKVTVPSRSSVTVTWLAVPAIQDVRAEIDTRLFDPSVASSLEAVRPSRARNINADDLLARPDRGKASQGQHAGSHSQRQRRRNGGVLRDGRYRAADIVDLLLHAPSPAPDPLREVRIRRIRVHAGRGQVAPS